MFCGLKHLGVYCGVVRNISWPSPNRDQIRHFSTLRMRHFWTWAFRGKPASSWPGEGFRHPDKTAVFIGLCPLCTWRWSWSLMIFDGLWWSLMTFVPSFQSKDSFDFRIPFPRQSSSFIAWFFPWARGIQDRSQLHLWKFLHLFLFADCHWWNIMEHSFFSYFSMGIQESEQDFHILGSTNLWTYRWYLWRFNISHIKNCMFLFSTTKKHPISTCPLSSMSFFGDFPTSSHQHPNVPRIFQRFRHWNQDQTLQHQAE